MKGQKLLVQGTIKPGSDATISGEIWRGMLVLDRDELVAGVVAAVVLDCRSQMISHILLGQLPPTAVYRLLPVSLIDQIAGERVWLQATQSQIQKLPLRRRSDQEDTK
jgi:hypothetical protein